jgi:hypothetical protein
VFNTDATQATDLPKDPYSQVTGAAGATHAGNIRPVAVPSAYYYLNLCLCWTDAASGTAIGGGPTVWVHGKLPRAQAQRAFPHDDSITDAADLSPGNIWVPLGPEGAVSGTAITPNTGIDTEILSDSKYLVITRPIPMYLAGTRQIVVTIATGATLGTNSAAFIGGWFSG